MLEHETNPSFTDSLPGNVLIMEQYRAAAVIGYLQPRYYAKKSCFSRSGWPKQRNQLARVNLQADVVKSNEVPKSLTNIPYFNTHGQDLRYHLW